jgi:hypothetical protein
MAKMLTDKEMGQIIHNATHHTEIIDDGDSYEAFLEGLSTLISDHFGGYAGAVSRPSIPSADTSEHQDSASKTLIETKRVEGDFTYDEALDQQDDGWRLPTIFELILIQRQAGLTSDNNEGWYWSSSPGADGSNGAWLVHFGNGADGRSNKNRYKYVRLVRGGQDFDYLRYVNEEEVWAFRESRTLPSWHPPLDTNRGLLPEEEWMVPFHWNDSVPEDGWVYALYDTDVSIEEWKGESE